MGRTEAEKKAQRKYLKAVMRRFYADLNANTDGDILAKLETEKFATYIKRLIREDIAREQKEAKK